MSGIRTHHNFDLKDTPSLKDKIALVTGGNAGIGREIVAQLLLHDILKVYILARNAQKFESAKTFWKGTHNLDITDDDERVEFIACDLSDMAVVKKVADDLMEKLGRLDILINNAGLPPVPDYTLSPQGIETIFATNVMGPFVLTNILLPELEKTAKEFGDARIIVTSSSLHVGCRELVLDETMSKSRVKSPGALDSCWRYARSKLGNILFTSELAKRLDKRGSDEVYANCFFPGNIPTEGMDCWKDLFGSISGGALKGIFQFAGQSLRDGAATAIYLAASKEVEEEPQKGKYFIPIATQDQTSKLAEDKDLAKNLWYWCDDKATKALGRGWDVSPTEQADIDAAM